MRPGWLVATFLAACAGPAATTRPPAEPDEGTRAVLADEEAFKPSYGRPELQQALISDRGAEASLETEIANLEAKDHDAATDDHLRTIKADLAVRRRFIAALEACEASGRWCPPRLDDPPWSFDPDPAGGPQSPPLTAPLRFDVGDWQQITTELHARACACRTLQCVDSMDVAINELEGRPTPEVLQDEAATAAITRARECLFRLRGKASD